MVFLRFFTFILLLIYSGLSWADYEVVCVPSSKCADIYSMLEAGDGNALQKTTIRSLGLDKSINYLKVIFKKNGKTVLYIEKKPLVRELSFSGPEDLDLDQVQKVSQLQDGVFYNPGEYREAKERVEYWLSERGFLNPSFDYSIKKVSGE